jgi:transposase
VIEATVAKGALVHTDEHDVHTRGEHARDDDGDGFCEVHVNTAGGFWSLLRSWLRPHRGVSQEKLHAYLGFFEVVHNARARGKALLSALVGGLVAPASAHHPETR